MPERKPVPLLIADVGDTIAMGPSALGHYINRAEDVQLYPEALDRMREWRAAGGRVVAVSNQGGIACELISADAVEALMARMMELTGDLIENVFWCPHHPSAKAPHMADCWCRKPRPGLVYQAVGYLQIKYPGECYPPDQALVVGDLISDSDMAHHLGVDFAWADAWRDRLWEKAAKSIIGE